MNRHSRVTMVPSPLELGATRIERAPLAVAVALVILLVVLLYTAVTSPAPERKPAVRRATDTGSVR